MLCKNIYRLKGKRLAFSQLSQYRLFSNNDVSNFDAHDDFAPKTKKPATSDVKVQIENYIQNNDVTLFMKGNRNMPQCGFSNYVVQCFKFYGVNYKDVNVLDDNNLRQGIKTFSEWPTIPQIYIKGNFIGGCDIMKEMHEDGSLQTHLIE